MEFDPIEEVIAAYGRGEIVIITDDENRENEGDLIAPAAKTDAATVNFMITHARGLFCGPRRRLCRAPVFCRAPRRLRRDFLRRFRAACGRLVFTSFPLR